MSNFSFPFDVNDQPAVESFFNALSMETDGFYPFGINEFWHGGVHITAKSSGTLKQADGIKCIADGEVVAYRINAAHLETPIYQAPEKDPLVTPYSTSFTLIRHTLEYPADSGKKLAVFSLYMHLLPWDGYSTGDSTQTEGKLAPEYLGRTVYKVKESTTDTETFAPGVVGTRGRISESGGEVLALYPKGAVLELAPNDGTGRAQVISIITGTVSRPEGQTANGYVHLGEVEEQTEPPTLDSVVIPTTAIPIKKGNLIGYMGQYCTPELSSGRALLHWEVFAGDNLKDFIGQARGANADATEAQKTIIKIPARTSLISPHEKPSDLSLATNSVIQKSLEQGDYIQCNVLGISVDVDRSLLGPPESWNSTTREYTPPASSYAALSALGVPIDASSRIPLLNQNAGSSRKVLLPQTPQTLWIKNSENLTEFGGRYVVSGSAQGWATYPESFTNEVIKIPEDQCIKSSDLDDKKTDENVVEWYPLAVHANNMCYFGYINSNNVTRHAPEEFICFKGIDAAGGSDASIHQNPSEYWRSVFAPITMESTSTEQSSTTPFELELHPFAKAVFQHMDGNHDGTISLSEVQSTLRDPTTQMKVGHLITKHESEWVKSMDRWKYIEQYIPDATRYDWDYEKEKIQNLAWWDDVKGKVTDFPSADAYYFHPAGFVGNFIESGCISLKVAKEVALQVSGAYEGLNPSYSSLAGNFDGAGMSWGIIQYNFGQDTLGPMLRKMRDTNQTLFDGAFENQNDLSTLNTVLSSGTINQQIAWAVNMQNNANSRWKDIFNNLAEVSEFQEIQLEGVQVYDNSAINIINWMRQQVPSVMEKIELATFVALHDLAIQQGSITPSARTNILSIISQNQPQSQDEFIRIVVRERGATANSLWRADCISRRLGILNKTRTDITHSGHSASRDNTNFALIVEGTICDL